MKKIFTIVIAAGFLLSLVSCQKEESKGIDSDSTKTERIITGLYVNDVTKTTLGTDNVTPLWTVGDKIRVLNNNTHEDITLSSDNITDGGKSITFSTTLSGTLYAVYPASATTIQFCTDSNIYFKIPAIQDGTFSSANICVASGDGINPNTLYFSNATAVVEMTVATGVEYANLTAANKLAGTMIIAMGTKGAINSTTTTDLSSNYIFVEGTPSDNKFYMAVAPVETGAVTVTCNTTSKSGSIGKGTKTLARNKIYAMDLSEMTINTDDLTGQHGVLNGQEYVLIKAIYKGHECTDSTYLKWSTQNLAVTKDGKTKWNGTNYVIGDYFQWAASYDGYGIEGSRTGQEKKLVIYDSFLKKRPGGTIVEFKFKDDKNGGFIIGSAPYHNSDSSSYTKYLHTDYSTLVPDDDDVVRLVFGLGSTWRMPKGGYDGEFQTMREATYWAWDDTDKGYYVFKPGVGTSGAANKRGDIAETDDKTKALLFFPAAGYGDKTDIQCMGNGYYWSRSLSSYIEYASNLYFNCDYVYPYNYPDERCRGFSVRPVSE